MFLTHQKLFRSGSVRIVRNVKDDTRDNNNYTSSSQLVSKVIQQLEVFSILHTSSCKKKREKYSVTHINTVTPNSILPSSNGSWPMTCDQWHVTNGMCPTTYLGSYWVYLPPEMTTLAAVNSGLSLLLSSWPSHSEVLLAGSMEGAWGKKQATLNYIQV